MLFVVCGTAAYIDIDIGIFYFSLKRYTFMVHIDKQYKTMGNIYINTIKTK